MSRHARRERRPLRRFALPAAGVLTIVLLGTAPIAVARFADRTAPTTDRGAAAAADLGGVIRHSRQLRLKTSAATDVVPHTDHVRAAQTKAKMLAERAARRARESAPFVVQIGSFNVLGSQHTGPGGDRQGFPSAASRIGGTASLIAQHGVDILGTQELMPDQLAALKARTGMAAYSGLDANDTRNTIFYDPSKYEFVSGDQFVIPMMSHPHTQPVLRLRDRASGREFFVINTHPSSHDGKYLVERRQGQAALVSVVNDLAETGLPVLITGDMNDREEFYCQVVPPAGLTAPNGGSYSSGCHPPPGPLPVDWVVGRGVTWSDYWRDTRPVSARISDHFFISATAHVD